MKVSLILGAMMVLISVEGASAKMMSDRERARAEAEHLCYDDVQRLCGSDIPNETKIEACMSRKRAKLSPGCRKVFESGMK